jgi:DNA repair exonuclease SbcCD ATPase subunit
MKNIFKKTILFALVAALGVASLPFVSVAAQGANDPTPPPTAQAQVSNEKLEQVWARQLKAYERMGKAEEFVAKVQKLLDRATANGKDVSAIQSALDAFDAALKDAKPIYESAEGIINSHQGFDANGKVTDPAKAKETIQAMHEKMQEIRTAMDGTGKALHEAIKAFREANPRPVKTPAP